VPGNGAAITSLRAFQLEAGAWRILSAGDDATMRLWDPEAGQVLALLPRHGTAVMGVRVFEEPETGRVCAASADNMGGVRVWDLGPAQARHEVLPRAANKTG
jgi:WD40 repeat protein